jgi:hypothetical protein
MPIQTRGGPKPTLRWANESKVCYQGRCDPFFRKKNKNIGYLMHEYTVLSPQKREERLMLVRR